MGGFLKSRTLMIRPHSTPREWGRRLRCWPLFWNYTIAYWVICQTPYQYPHSMLSTSLNYSDYTLSILLNICFDFQQLYLYPYVLLMKIRLVSNYANVTSASWIFSKGYVKENKWGMLYWKNWASNSIEKKTNNSDFHKILAIKQGIQESSRGVVAGNTDTFAWV